MDIYERFDGVFGHQQMGIFWMSKTVHNNLNYIQIAQ